MVEVLKHKVDKVNLAVVVTVGFCMVLLLVHNLGEWVELDITEEEGHLQQDQDTVLAEEVHLIMDIHKYLAVLQKEVLVAKEVV